MMKSSLRILLLVSSLLCHAEILLTTNPVLQDGPDAEVAGVSDLGPLRFLPIIRGRDVGFSARFGGRSVWVFGDTPLNSAAEDGSRWRSGTWAWAAGFDARRGLVLREPLDRKKAPAEFLPFRPEELAYNSSHNREELGEARSRWGLWVGPLVIEPSTGRALVFYSKVMCKVGPWAFESVGQSLALWDRPDHPRVRPDVRPGANEPTMLFPRGDVPPAAGAMAIGDEIYAYHCSKTGTAFPCILGRVTFANALKREAWRFFAGNDRWSDDWHAAVPVMNAAPMLTVHWNQHLKRFLAVYSTPLVNTIEIRTAKRPQGPWSMAQVVVTGLAPRSEGTWDYCGMAHPELARGNGRVEYITYCRDTGFLLSEIRLVELRFK